MYRVSYISGRKLAHRLFKDKMSLCAACREMHAASLFFSLSWTSQRLCAPFLRSHDELLLSITLYYVLVMMSFPIFSLLSLPIHNRLKLVYLFQRSPCAPITTRSTSTRKMGLSGTRSMSWGSTMDKWQVRHGRWKYLAFTHFNWSANIAKNPFKGSCPGVKYRSRWND